LSPVALTSRRCTSRQSSGIRFLVSASRPLAISERLLPDRAFPILQSRPQGSWQNCRRRN
jgi:hypothetical protein